MAKSGNGTAWTGETHLDGVEDKLLSAVLAGLRAFGALGHAVLG